MRFVLDPLADVTVPVDALPNSVSVLNAVDPFSIISVSVSPRVEALSSDSTELVVAQVLVSVAKPFVPLAVTFVCLPGPLVYA